MLEDDKSPTVYFILNNGSPLPVMQIYPHVYTSPSHGYMRVYNATISSSQLYAIHVKIIYLWDEKSC